MIGRLRGILVANRAGKVCIDVGGVGYDVSMTPRDAATLPGLGEEVVVHAHTHVREDEISVYGFSVEADRDLFRVLVSASGVGPKLAASMLASLEAADIVRAIGQGDPDALTVTPGIGKKGAQKIVLELSSKLSGEAAEIVGGGGPAAVRQALEGLGYSQGEISEAISEVDPAEPIEAQVKAALQSLGRR